MQGHDFLLPFYPPGIPVPPFKNPSHFHHSQVGNHLLTIIATFINVFRYVCTLYITTRY